MKLVEESLSLTCDGYPCIGLGHKYFNKVFSEISSGKNWLVFKDENSCHHILTVNEPSKEEKVL